MNKETKYINPFVHTGTNPFVHFDANDTEQIKQPEETLKVSVVEKVVGDETSCSGNYYGGQSAFDKEPVAPIRNGGVEPQRFFSSFSKKKVFSYVSLLDLFLLNNHILFDEKAIFAQEGFRYVEISALTLKARIQAFIRPILQDELDDIRVTRIFNLLLTDDRVHRSKIDWNNDFVAFRNGLFHLWSGTFSTAPTTVMCRHYIDCDFIPEVNFLPSEFANYIDFASSGNPVLAARLIEAFTISLIPIKLKRIFYIFGAADSGKSTLMDLAILLLGDSATTFEVDKLQTTFGLSPLDGKALAVCDDAVESAWCGSTLSLLKSAVSINGSVPVNKKYKEHKAFDNSRLKVFILSNYPPTIAECDSGIASRLKVIALPNSIPEERRAIDFNLTLLALAAPIVSYCFSTVLPALLSRNFQLSGDNETQALLEQMSRRTTLSQMIESFLTDCLIDKKGAFVTTEELYRTFCAFCGNAGALIGQKKFSATVREILGESTRRKIADGTTPHGYSNVAVVMPKKP